MKKVFILLLLLGLAAFASACGGNEVLPSAMPTVLHTTPAPVITEKPTAHITDGTQGATESPSNAASESPSPAATDGAGASLLPSAEVTGRKR